MKKLLVMIMVLAMALVGLTACGNGGAAAGPVSVNNDVQTEDTEASDGNIARRLVYSVVSVDSDNEALTAAVAEWSQEYNDEFVKSCSEGVDDSDNIYEGIEPMVDEDLLGTDKGVYEYQSSTIWGPTESDLGFPSEKNNGVILSLYMARHSEMAGAAHGYMGLYGINFDVATGAQITLESLSAANEEFESAAKAAIIEQLKAQNVEPLDGSVEDSVNDNWMNGSTHFVFTDEGMVFWYNPYDMCSYAEGFIKAEVPYDVIGEYIDSKYTK